MKDLMNNWNSFTFSNLENYLNQIAPRHHHAIFRIYLDYPGITMSPDDAVPEFLINGLKFYTYTEYGGGVSPDFDNQTLLNAIIQLIQQLAKTYDGDNRVGFIQVGFLGHWGEWHDEQFPFASKDSQSQVLLAFNQSFTKTQILLRYAQVSGNYAPTDLRVGFHDDSFAQDTLEYSWGFYDGIVQTGATNQWQKYPIGGELRPELQICIFTPNPNSSCSSTGLIPQSFANCASTTHASWLWDNAGFANPGYPSQDLPLAFQGDLQLGYQFFINNVSTVVSNNAVAIQVALTNMGNAPFYYSLVLMAEYNNKNYTVSASLENLLPGNTEILSTSFPYSSSANSYSLFLDSYILLKPIIWAISGASNNGLLTIPLSN